MLLRKILRLHILNLQRNTIQILIQQLMLEKNSTKSQSILFHFIHLELMKSYQINLRKMHTINRWVLVVPNFKTCISVVSKQGRDLQEFIAMMNMKTWLIRELVLKVVLKMIDGALILELARNFGKMLNKRVQRRRKTLLDRFGMNSMIFSTSKISIGIMLLKMRLRGLTIKQRLKLSSWTQLKESKL